MSALHPLKLASNETGTDAVSQFCKAAGDDLRARVLQVLRHNAYGVLELCQIFDIRQPAMSHHLKVLAAAGLVSTRREGTTIFYRRNPSNPVAALDNLQHALFQTIDGMSLDSEIKTRIDAIYRERSAASLAFFQQNADKLRDNRDLIASWTDYGDSVENFLSQSVADTGLALEIGPGYGEFLEKLSRTFSQVVALDNSAEMLARSRETAKRNSLKNIRFIEGDTRTVLESGIAADCISLNMVLHHNAAPASIIADCAAMLTFNGVLLITDFCSHQQTWVRESCGDLWLGFEPEELSEWALAAGLNEGESLYLAQRNGFRIQLRQFIKSSH